MPPQPGETYLAIPSPGDDEPQAWLSSAERLLYGGQQLWKLAEEGWASMYDSPPHRHPAQPGQFAPAFLLFGYAFENLLKGLLRQQTGKAPTGHKLVAYATNAGLKRNDLDQDEWDLLERLTVHIKWAGRYPVPLPKDRQNATPFKPVPGSEIYRERDPKLIGRLFEELARRYAPPLRRIDGRLTR